MSDPIALTDEQLDIVRRAAEPLHPQDRRAFLLVVAELLNGHEIGDGVVARAARDAQQRFLRPVEIRAAGGSGKYR
jgi:hypothetical protein